MTYQFYLPCLLVILIHLLSFQATTNSSTVVTSSLQTSFRVQLERVSFGSNVVKCNTTIGDALAPSMAPSPPPDFQTIILQAKGEFIMNISLGSPPRRFSAIMDTGSSIIWMQCMPYKNCYAQPTLIFNPNTSSSFSPLPCSSFLCPVNRTRECEANLCKYRTIYGDGSITEGYLASETLTLGNTIQNVSLPNIAFGCGLHNTGISLDIVTGLVGLGRGPLSLVSQLKPKKFSYCLPTVGENKKGTLSFGSLADEGYNATTYKGTPLLINPILPSHYYIYLEGISLDDTFLPIPKSVSEINLNGSSGMILDSGTSMTYLVVEAYEVLKVEFAKRTKLPAVSSPSTDWNLCFQMTAGVAVSNISFPKLKFHFKDMMLELPKENYLVEDSFTSLVCLQIMPSLGMSIFGSQHQQSFLVLHDLEKQTVSFLPTQCA